jgi:hypothetical protein
MMTILLFKKSVRFCFFIICSLAMIQCGPSVGATSQSGSNQGMSSGSFYTSFFLNDSTTTYFVKPILFKASKSELMVDYTLKKVHGKLVDVVMNFSVISTEKIPSKEITDISFNGISLENFKVMFNEPSRKKHEIRFTSVLPQSNLVQMKFPVTFAFEISGKQLLFQPTKKTHKILKDVQTLSVD